VIGEGDYEAYVPLMDAKQVAKGKVQDYFRKTWRTVQMSGHLPLWVELKVDFSGQYLEDLKKKYATGKK